MRFPAGPVDLFPGPRRGALCGLCGVFVLTGVVNTLLGPLLPAAVHLWRLSDIQAGLFFPAQFIASVAGALGMARLAKILTLRGCFTASLLLMAVGVASVGAGTPMAALAAVACFGFGLGVNIPAANCLAARLAPGKAAPAVTALNFAWGLGAVLGPVAASPSFAAWSLRAPLAVLGAALLAAAFVSIRLFPRKAGTPVGETNTSDLSPAAPARRLTFLVACLLFLYVGAENSTSGWLPLLAQRTQQTDPAQTGAVVAIFWAALLAIRGFVPVALRRWDANRCVSAGILIFLAGTAILMGARSKAVLFGSAAVMGFGLGPIFPLSVALFHTRGGGEAERRMGFVFAAASMGGACLPPLVGAAGQLGGGLPLGFAVAFAAGLVMLALHRHLAATSFADTA